MLRESLRNHAAKGFRHRGGEIARIEGLSDAVFAFAVTLLVVSLEVPKTFNELAGIMRGFTAFAISFTLLMRVWYEQYVFFRRYNLQDTGSVVLNAILLFVVLFYVYPLKFLFTYLVNGWTGASTLVHLPGGGLEKMIEPEQLPQLMAIFGAGYLAVSGVFALLFGRALRKREELELRPLEIFETRVSIGASLINGSAAAISLGIALAGCNGPAVCRSPGGAACGAAAGVIYPIVLGPSFTVFYSLMGRRKRKLGLTTGAEG